VTSPGWAGANGQADNSARAPGRGDWHAAPAVAASVATGGAADEARVALTADGWLLLVRAGETLTVLDENGRTRWHDAGAGASRIVFAGELAGGRYALYLAGTRQLTLLDLEDGTRLWRWSAPIGSFLSPDGIVLVESDGRVRCSCFPVYTTAGVCFDLTDPEQPARLWSVAYGSRWDRGFGPNAIALPDGGLLLASRIGARYDRDPDTGRTTTAELVRGRSAGALYQAVLDADTGDVVTELRWRPDPDGYPYARPYGLLAAHRDAVATTIVLASCQVEEFVAVTELRGRELRPLWSRFVEKDWPLDERELRPQTSSLTDVDGDGEPELVLGLWDGAWTTWVLGLRDGFEDPRAQLPGRYFWGTVQSALVTSDEPERTPRCRDGLVLVDFGRGTERRVAGVRPLTLPGVRSGARASFMADHSDLAVADGELVVVGANGGLDLIDSAARPKPFAPRAAGLAVAAPVVVAVDADGALQPVGAGWSVSVAGRAPTPLLWSSTPVGPELVLDLAGGRIGGYDPLTGERRWEVRGRLAALVAAPEPLLTVAERQDDGDAVVVYARRPGGLAERWRCELGGEAAVALVPFGSPLAVVATVRTGTHTSRLVVASAAGTRFVRDGGAHPAPPAIWARPDGDLVVVDDHGALSVFTPDGELVLEHDWFAAYSTPIPIPERDAILRASATHGLALVRSDGSLAWRRELGLWRLFPGSSALLGPPGESWGVASAGVDGRVRVHELDTGRERATRRLPLPAAPAVAAADLDGDGRDELLVGCADDRLRCLDGATLEERWSLRLDAPVGRLAIGDVDGDGLLDAAAATADGRVHVLRQP
jgi:outer membrane protein assembly factor BamB